MRYDEDYIKSTVYVYALLNTDHGLPLFAARWHTRTTIFMRPFLETNYLKSLKRRQYLKENIGNMLFLITMQPPHNNPLK